VSSTGGWRHGGWALTISQDAHRLDGRRGDDGAQHGRIPTTMRPRAPCFAFRLFLPEGAARPWRSGELPAGGAPSAMRGERANRARRRQRRGLTAILHRQHAHAAGLRCAGRARIGPRVALRCSRTASPDAVLMDLAHARHRRLGDHPPHARAQGLCQAPVAIVSANAFDRGLDKRRRHRAERLRAQAGAQEQSCSIGPGPRRGSRSNGWHAPHARARTTRCRTNRRWRAASPIQPKPVCARLDDMIDLGYFPRHCSVAR